MKSLLQKLPKRIIFDLLFLFMLSLTPFLWLKHGEMIAGHDAGLPFSPTVHWQDRLNTWTDRYDAGKDQSFALAGFFIHGYEALLEQTGLSLTHQQLVQFSTYFFLMGLSMYIMFSIVFEKKYRYVAIVAATAYQINHFILQAWFIAERTKFSVYIAVPLAITILHLLIKRKLSPIQSAIGISLIFFLFNGGGFLPLYGASIVTLATFVIVLWFIELKKKEHFFRIVNVLFFTVILSVGLNSYWLLPYGQYVKGNFSFEVSAAGGVDGVINWIQSISENTSYLNITRLQGIQEWYVNAEHPYATFYFSSVLLTFISFLFPILPVYILLKYKETPIFKYIIVFLSIYILSVFLMSGSHPPFGFIYIWFVRHIPGFIAFRTPFYKFAPGLWIAFSPFLALFIHQMTQLSIFNNLPFKKNLFIVFGIIGIAAYHFPFFTVNIFQYTHERTTKIIVPDYVHDYTHFSNSSDFAYQRILLLPGSNPQNDVFEYDWKYWSLASPLSLLDKRAYVSPSEKYRLDQKVELALFNAIVHENEHWETYAYADGIDAILIQEDVIPYTYRGQNISWEKLKSTIEKSPNVQLEKRFGKWTLYSLRGTTHFYSSDSYITLADSTRTFHTPVFLYSYLKLSPTTPIAPSVQNDLKLAGQIIIPECQDCSLSRQQYVISSSNPVASPGSLLYPIFQFLHVEGDQERILPENSTINHNDQLFSSFMNKAEYSARKIIWSNYLKSIEKYQDHIEAITEKSPETLLANNQLQLHLNNLISQEQKLRTISSFINREEEAQTYYKIIGDIMTMEQFILEKVITTKNLHENTYPIDIPTTGEYTVSVYLPTTNIFYYQDKSLQVLVDDSPIDITQTQDWGSSSLQLLQGLHEIQINDAVYKSIFLTDSSQEELHITYGGNNRCGSLSMGTLDIGTYVVAFQVKSLVNEIKPTFHTIGQDQKIPTLAYWGLPQSVSDSTWRMISMPFEAKEHSEHFLLICDEAAGNEIQVVLKSVSLDRLVDPFIAVSTKELQNQLRMANTQQLSFNRDNPTKYSIDISAQNTPIIVNSFIHYSPFWKINNDSAPTPYNGFYSAWKINQDSDQQIHLMYTIQKLYIWGWRISIMSMFIILILLINMYKRYQLKK